MNIGNKQMRLPKLSYCTACALLATSSIAWAQPSIDGLLQSQIEISWHAPVGQLAQLIAKRLDLPYQPICSPDETQLVSIEQSGSSSMTAALQAANAQMQGQTILLGNSPAGMRVELVRNTPGSGCENLPTTNVLPPSSTSVAQVHVAPIPVAARPRYELREGEPVHEQMQAWAQAAGWKLLWYPRVSWLVVSNADVGNSDVASAVESVVGILRAEGKQILLSIAPANRVMEITSTDITAESDDTNDE